MKGNRSTGLFSNSRNGSCERVVFSDFLTTKIRCFIDLEEWANENLWDCCRERWLRYRIQSGRNFCPVSSTGKTPTIVQYNRGSYYCILDAVRRVSARTSRRTSPELAESNRAALASYSSYRVSLRHRGWRAPRSPRASGRAHTNTTHEPGLRILLEVKVGVLGGYL